MKTVKLLPLFLLFASTYFMTSCSEPCDDVVCETGFTCVDGECIQDGDSTNLPATISSDMTLAADEIHTISGKVVVESGATLTIEPGTIIKGEQGTGASASALIVARGARIMADGTPDNPIIFTSTLDNITIGQTSGTNLEGTDNQKWGGVIILGRAPISVDDNSTEALIEGLPGDEIFGLYGGNDPADNSGVLRYVSIRHGGAEIGEGNEINGLTLGGVGTGTVIDNIEVTANLDDGIECFGGTVNIDNAVVTWQGDDAIDLDQAYSGTIDNFYVGHGGDDTDEALEIDGPEGDLNGAFTLLNGTCVAYDQTVASAGDFKDGSLGLTRGVCFKGYANGVKVRTSFDAMADCAATLDSYTNLIASELRFENNMFEETADMVNVYTDADAEEQACFETVEDNYQSAADNAMTSGGNAVGSCTGGANTSVFDWTLSAQKGWIQ